jgi:hypothetical protein
MEQFRIENPLSQQVPIECLKVAQIEDDPVPFRNGPLVERIRPHEIEELVRPRAGLRQAFKEFMPNFDTVLRGAHFLPS